MIEWYRIIRVRARIRVRTRVRIRVRTRVRIRVKVCDFLAVFLGRRKHVLHLQQDAISDAFI